MAASHAFITGFAEGAPTSYLGELSPREIVERHPDYTTDEIDAYHQGRTDALTGDTWRYDRLLVRAGR